MINYALKNISCILLLLTGTYAVAATDVITITVKTNEKSAFAIGYTVDGERAGSLGKSYTSQGPKNKEYFFGYKKDSIFGNNISCGSLILTQDSIVNLITEGTQCISVLN